MNLTQTIESYKLGRVQVKALKIKWKFSGICLVWYDSIEWGS